MSLAGLPSLPFDIWTHVMSFVDLATKLTKVQFVSRGFGRLARATGSYQVVHCTQERLRNNCLFLKLALVSRRILGSLNGLSGPYASFVRKVWLKGRSPVQVNDWVTPSNVQERSRTF